jgi:hypothetical protein
LACENWQGPIRPRDGMPVYIAYRPRTTRLAHYKVWEDARGPIPRNYRVIQTCGNKMCVHLGHLKVISRSEAIPRVTHCKQGHEFTPENTYIAPGSPQQHCIKCGYEAARRYRKKRGSGPRLTADIKSMSLADKIAYFEAHELD